ncbi:histidine utilization repressor [Nocardia otitidiscaviarum]|uniref:histidine utilization repressor n=1 Tax=Nocardia otitidiscaviarum TaxID=1823 RepID=UPI001E4CFFFB|nr:histidine utilization repressor [Nocardia otitidiscaviarum]
MGEERLGGMAAVDGELAALFEQSGGEAVPAYERVKNLVSAQIRSGRWVEGDQVPSEHQLVAATGLSRMTVNRALRELAAEGLIVRTAGVGTFVGGAKASSPLFEVRNIADDIARRGHRHHTEVILVRAETIAPDHTHLRDSLGATAFHSILVHYEGGTPIQLEDRYVNPTAAPDYLAQDFTTTTPNDYLSRVAPLIRGEHIVEAVLATPDECHHLHITPTEPCLLIRRRTWSATGLVSVARLLHPGSRNRLEGVFGR